MPLFIIPEWLQQRKIFKIDLTEIHAFFWEITCQHRELKEEFEMFSQAGNGPICRLKQVGMGSRS